MTKEYDEIISQHYQKVAKRYGAEPTSSMQDQHIRQQECFFIAKEVNSYCLEVNPLPRVLEIGCGNGHLLGLLREEFPLTVLHGIEISPDLLQIALDRKLERVKITQDDCRREQFLQEAQGTYDLIITERVIINILSREDQHKALSNIEKLLIPGGRYIMVESFEEPLNSLNKAAQEMAVKEYQPSKHNLYLNESITEYLLNLGFVERSPSLPTNYLSSHFFLTRIFHESLRKPTSPMKETEFVKFFTAAIPPAIGDYSPILFRSFKKVAAES